MVDHKKLSISLPPPLIARLGERKGADPLSQQIGSDLTVFWAAISIGLAEVQQKLSREEAKAILDVLNGVYWDSSCLSLMLQAGVSLEVEDGCRLEGLDRKWHIDGKKLVAKLKSISALETLAVLDWARVYWKNHKNLSNEQYVENFREESVHDQDCL